MTSSLYYPDDDFPIGDKAVLRNAIVFTTAQRAYSARRILNTALDGLHELERAFVAVESFQQYVVSLEDFLGWLFVLRDWKPGAPETSLFALLDAVRVGKGPWSEQKALELVEALDATRYRQLVHVPTSEELLAAGWQKEMVIAVDEAMQPQLDGWKTAIERRVMGNRALVKAFNKSKHMLLGLLTKKEGRVWVDLLTSNTGYRDQTRGIVLGGAILGCEVADIQRRAREAIQIQAVLNSLLTIILWARYGERLPSAGWVGEALELPGWLT